MGASHYIDPNFQAQAITVEGRFPPADSNTSASSSDPPLASRPVFISQEILTNYIQHIMTLISFSRSIMCARQINGDRSIVGATMEYRWLRLWFPENSLLVLLAPQVDSQGFWVYVRRPPATVRLSFHFYLLNSRTTSAAWLLSFLAI